MICLGKAGIIDSRILFFHGEKKKEQNNNLNRKQPIRPLIGLGELQFHFKSLSPPPPASSALFFQPTRPPPKKQQKMATERGSDLSSSSLMLTSGASGRINALLSLRVLRSLMMLINAFFLLLLLPFRGRKRAPSSSAAAASPVLAEKSAKDERQPRGPVVRVPTTIVPWKSSSSLPVDTEVAARRALAKLRVVQDNDENSVRRYSLFATARGETLFTQSWTPVSVNIRGVVILMHGLNEHSGRYDYFAKQLNANGFKVYGMDWIANSSALSLSSVEPLSGGNFKKWKQDIEILLGLMDLDLALREDEPAALTGASTAEERHKHEKWEKANRMSLMVMKRTMSDTVRGGVTGCDKARDFLDAIGAKFKESEKAEMGELMTTLTSLKFDEGKGVREHILKLVNTAAKLKDLDVPVDEAFVVHMALTSLPSCYDQLKVTYSTQKEKWSMDELISIAAQEECRLRRNVNRAAVNFVHADKRKKPFFHSGKAPKLTSNNSAVITASSSKGPENYKDIMDNIRCYFCKRTGHMKRDCEKLKDLKTKKGFHKKRFNNKK